MLKVFLFWPKRDKMGMILKGAFPPRKGFITMKFSEMTYTRPDIDALLARCKELTAKAAAADSGEALVEVYYEQSRAFADYNTAANLANIHYTCDTRDACWKAEQDFFDANGPAVSNASVEISRAFLANPHGDALTDAVGSTCVAGRKTAVRGTDERTVALQQEYNALVSTYQQIYGGALVELDGKQLTIPQLGPYKESTDAAVRRAAYEAEAGYFDAHRAALEASVPEFEFRFNALDDVHAEDVLWADIVLGNAPVPMIRQTKHIEWFQSNSAGPDAYLKPGVLPENCMVTNATGAYGLAISEWMLAMWLGIQKDLFLYRDRQNQRQWAPIDRPVRGITGARVLCVGMGDIGSNFARRAHMLGAEVVGVRRTVHPDTPCPDYCLRVVAQSQLDEELPAADLIALSLPGTPETNKLFNAERFAKCKDGAILINVGRGTTVDSDALVEALRSGKIFGAGLDVTDPEPLPADHPLWGEPGAIITPHNSGKFSLPKTLDNIVDIFIHNLKRYAEGLPLDNQVNRTTLYAADQNGGHRLLSTL